MDHIRQGITSATVWGWCPTGKRAGSKEKEEYLHIGVDLGGGLLEVFSCHAGHAFGQFFGVDASVVVHEVVGGGLSQVVLGLVVHDLVVNPSLSALQLLVADLRRVIWVKRRKLE
jgi:hypothetical protein